MATKKSKVEAKSKPKRWSQHVTESSFALDLERMFLPGTILAELQGP
jgi:hypothetical protein